MATANASGTTFVVTKLLIVLMKAMKTTVVSAIKTNLSRCLYYLFCFMKIPKTKIIKKKFLRRNNALSWKMLATERREEFLKKDVTCEKDE